jgi:hypothetical protein
MCGLLKLWSAHSRRLYKPTRHLAFRMSNDQGSLMIPETGHWGPPCGCSDCLDGHWGPPPCGCSDCLEAQESGEAEKVTGD